MGDEEQEGAEGDGPSKGSIPAQFPHGRTPSLRTNDDYNTPTTPAIPCCNAVPMKGILTAFLAGIGKGLVRGFVPVRCVGSQP